MLDLSLTHFTFSQNVLMLAFEDLLPLGIVSSPFLRSLDQSCLPLKAASG